MTESADAKAVESGGPSPDGMTVGMAPTGARVEWLDVVKGVVIMLVVIGHAWRGLFSRNLIAPSLFEAVDARIYAFHMPVFFAISGFFLARQIARSSFRSFVLSRAHRLLWPLIIWTYLFMFLRVLAGDAANTQVGWADLLRLPFPGYAHLWFLWALFLLHLAAYATRGLIVHDRYPRYALILLAGLTLFLALVPAPPSVRYWIGPALAHAPFLALGLVLGQSSLIHGTVAPTRWVAGGVAISLILLWPLLPTWPELVLVARIVLTASFIIMLSAAVSRRLDWLARTGQASMAIFLSHTIFSAAGREALLAFEITGLFAHMAVGVLLGLVGPMILLWGARKTQTASLLGF